MTTSKLVPLALVFLGLASSASAQYTPTISGINAWWWLGGILYDGPPPPQPGCATNPPGPCYWSEAPLTASPNGAPGTPTWQVKTVQGGGSVSLTCSGSGCATVIATATAPSNGCNYDVTVTVSYGQYQSAPFKIFISTITSVTPYTNGYPLNSGLGAYGYQSAFVWSMYDQCGGPVSGLHINENYGSWTDDYYRTQGEYNTWNLPGTLTPNAAYFMGNVFEDVVGASRGGVNIPNSLPPYPPLGNVMVEDDYPFTIHAWSVSIGVGALIYTDDQQWFQDHGWHSGW